MLDHAAEPQLLPLASLTHDPLNPRNEIDPEGTAALAASIRAIGLIQPLAGRRIGKKKVGIIVGGRRLAALKSMGADAPVTVPVVIAPDDATAEAWATADPVTHRQLHPADEIRAYGRMARSTPAPQIAAAFGVTEAHVRRRLALASLPDAAIDALKAGKITLSAAAILTTASNEDRILEVLAASPESQCPGDYWWHRQLHPASISGSDRRALFVGMIPYLAAGGTATPDLFADSSILHDVSLLDRLFAEKLAVTAERIRDAEGWGFVIGHPGSALWDLKSGGMHRADPQRDPDPEIAEQIEQLESERASETDRAALRDLFAREQCQMYPDRSDLGIAVYVDADGEIGRSIEVWARKGKGKGADASGEAGSDDQVSIKNPNAADEIAISQSLRDELQKIRHTALRTALLGSPALAIDLLSWSLSGRLNTWSLPVAVSLGEPGLPPVEAGCTVDPRLAPRPFAQTVNQSPTSLSAWLETPPADRANALAIAACRGLNSLDPEVRTQLSEVLEVNPRAIWTPTAANFFGRLRGPALDAIWEQLFAGHSPEADAAWAKLKTKEKAAELGRLFTDSDHRAAWGMGEQHAAQVDAWMPVI